MSEPTDVLKSEAEWLMTAHANSADKGFSEEFRRGFQCAAGWVAFHARTGLGGAKP